MIRTIVFMFALSLGLLASAQTPNCNLTACAAQISWVQPCAGCSVTVLAGPMGVACNPAPSFAIMATGVAPAGPWVDAAVPAGTGWKRCYALINMLAGVASQQSAHVEVTWPAGPPPAPTAVKGSVVAQ